MCHFQKVMSHGLHPFVGEFQDYHVATVGWENGNTGP